MLYSGKLSREKTFTQLVKIRSLRKFSWIARFCSSKGHHSPNFVKKPSCIVTKPRNLRKFSPSKVFRYTVPGKILQCTLLKKNKDMNFWTHFSSWRVWFTRKLSLSAHTPSCLIWFALRLQNVREREMRGGSTNLFTLCKVYLVSAPH